MKNFTKQFILLSSLVAFAQLANAQVKIGDNPTTINKGAILELEHANKGLLFPRVSLTNTTTWSLASGSTPVAGMMVYNIKTITAGFSGTTAYPSIAGDGTGIYYWDGNGWVAAKGLNGADGKSVTGAAGAPGATTPGNEGDTYINTTTGDTYIKQGNTWVLNGNIKGAKGDPGVVGVQGMPGTSGTPGTPGSGTPGAPGAGITIVNNDSGTWVYNPATNTWTNINGPKGDKGDPGIQSMAGANGAPGAPGTPGGPGAGVTVVTNDSGTWVYNTTTGTWSNINGPKGDKGDPGVVGVQGMPGTSGAPGTPGSGTPGAPGAGVTIVTNDSGTWVYNPATNTWTNINGPKGDKGDPGVVGVQGMPGTSGAPGTPGSGTPGAPGAGITIVTNDSGTWVYNPATDTWTNINGPKGDKGDPGVVGVQGMPGTSGAPGTPGSGTPGAPGAGITIVTNDSGTWVYNPATDTWTNINGPKGDKGDKGDPGVVGVQGMPGTSGAPGTPGSGTPGAPGAGITIVTNDSGTWVYNPATDTWTNINGPKGDKGDKGDPGVVGVQGMPGTSGAPGTPGSGTPGAPGAGITIVTNDSGTWVYNPATDTWTNINGPKGDKGDPGVVGVQGMPGTSGAPGTPGSGTPGAPGAGITIVTNDSGTWVYNPATNTWTNINGPKGDKGDPGVVGVQGMPGTSGAPGTPGSGTPGAPGAGITIVTNDSGTWVYNPATDTWTNINGPKGDKGDPGVVGVQGMPGTSGAPGTPGSGTPGAPGAGITIVTNDSGTWVYNPATDTWTNINGPKGDKGDKGDPGVVGVQGMPGTSGAPGTPGSGTPGAPGAGITIVTNDSGTWVYNPATDTWTNINGPKGDKGDKGDPGVVGVQGMPGTSGAPGTPGSGTPGAPGAGITIVTNDSGTWVYNPATDTWTNINGPKGDKGDKGDPGVVGVQGMPGTSGAPGTPGSGTPGAPGAGITIVTNDSGTWVYNPATDTWTNINGPKGDKGDPGVVGVQGMPGTSGAPGTPGSGTPGAPGAGITIVTNDSGTWVYNPATDTWTNINGPKGDKGDPGVVGVQGMPGTSGAPGTPGSGTPGAPGAGITIVTNDSGTWVYNPATDTWTNINGPKGDKGDKGDPGVVGVQGMPGTSGAPGTPGSGTPGAPGAGITIVTNDSGTWVYNPATDTWTNINGPKGDKGDKGDPGVVGVQGMPGTSGAPGTPGSGTPGAPGAGITIVTNDSGTWVYNPATDTWTNINGPKGDKGDKGDPGVVGVQGMPGTSGAPGTPGSGTPGAPGAGITIVTNDSGTWVYNPATDTWTNINGPKGDKGDPGVVGVQGMPGTSGAPGTPGSGTPGAPGAGITIVTNDSGTWVYNPATDTWTNINGPKGDKGDKGDPGVVGVQGMPGTSGAPGTPGSGTPGAPGAGITIVTNDSGTWVYNPATDTWTNINGPKGDKGDPGVVGVQGMPGTSGAPGTPGSGTPGAPGAGITIVTNDSGTWVYNPATDTWTNINGPAGPAGAQGPAGTNGKTILTGTGAPGAGVGTDGDYYMDPTTNIIYGPKVGGAWPATGTSLVGPAGEQGPQGPTGTTAAVTADNGLTKTTDNIQLGGSLIKPTAIATTAANTLALTGLQSGSNTDDLVVKDPATGVLKYLGLGTLVTEPWNVENTTTKATTNTQNIYQNGRVGIGNFGSALTTKQLEVKGDFKSEIVSGATAFGTEVNSTANPGSAMHYWTNGGLAGDHKIASVSSSAALLQAKTGTTTNGVYAMDTEAYLASINGTNSASTARTLNNGEFRLESYNVASNFGSTVSLQSDGMRLRHTNTNGAADPFPLNNSSEIFVQKINGVRFNFRDGAGAQVGEYWFPTTSGTNGQVMTQTATGKMVWSDPAALLTEVDGVIGNEVTDATANGGLTRTGAGTTASPYTLGLTPGTATGNVMTWNGTAWNPAAPVNIYNANGTLTSNRTVTMGGRSLTFSAPERDIYFDPNGRIGVQAKGTNDADIYVTSGSGATYNRFDIQSFPSGSLNLTATGAGAEQIRLGSSFTANPVPLLFSTSAGGNTSGVERMRITGTGNVGVNTDIPTEKLDNDGITRLRNLPLNGATNAIHTTIAGGESSSQDQTFTATRTVVADANGVLGTVAGLPATPVNIYNANGTLDADRTVTTGNNFLRFTGNGNTVGITTNATEGRVTATGTNRGSITVTGGNSIVDIYADNNLKGQVAARGTGTTGLDIRTEGATPLSFLTNNAQRMRITPTGEVAIGATTAPSFVVGGSTIQPLLHVAGDISTTGKLWTTNSVYADYVFEDYFNGFSKIYKDYKFKSLKEVAEFIKKNKHLPGVTPINEVAVGKNGYTIDLTQLSMQQLEKLEELYLHVIEMNDTLSQKDKEIKALQNKTNELEERLKKLESLLIKP